MLLLYSFVENFNSIKVQLKPDSPSELAQKALFQFHKGTIKTTNNKKLVEQLQISIP